jgi:hypothetical protein
MVYFFPGGHFDTGVRVSAGIAMPAAGSPSVDQWLLDRLTNDGRISFRLACSRLTTWERALIHHLLGRADIELVPGPEADRDLVRVTSSRLFGVAFWRPDEEPEPQPRTLGWLRIPADVLDAVTAETRAVTDREAAEQREVDALIRAWEAAGELDDQLAAVADWVERVETVYVFVGRHVFSKSDAGSNTLIRDGLIEGLRAAPPHEWRPSDRLFVVAAHCLFDSGRSVRFEEFNGRQLSATALRQHLLDRYAGYCAAAGADPGDFHGLSLLELAGRIRALIPEVDASPAMRYRRINGLTFVKNEYLTRPHLRRDPDRMPELVAEYGYGHLGTSPTGDVRADLRAMTRAAAQADAQGTGPGPADGGAVGELLGAIVMSAIERTDSDYGMSSSVRDLASLRGARPGGPEGVLALKKDRFFCCCLPHSSRMDGLPDEETTAILWRAAQRMMYNRWHFAPGEFDRALIPRQRHYFFPPQIPDIAVHAEHHHGGHVASRVRYSIRAPGAQAWLPPFRLFGHGFRGCYDIRLVRMEGAPYTMVELAEAVRHCSLVDELWRTLAQGIEHGVFPVVAVGGFDRTWYESRGWQRMRPYLAARRESELAPL